MASLTIHLRRETKPLEKRSALTPTTAQRLVNAGYKLKVERDELRIFEDAAFEAVGAELVPADSWHNAPASDIILGLKELPEQQRFPLKNTHVQFAHCYKRQAGWDAVLSRFVEGGGTLLDLEFLEKELENKQRRRIAAFGYHAGYAGAALALQAWSWQFNDTSGQSMGSVEPFDNVHDLLSHIRDTLANACEKAGRKPRVFVMGAKGRCGGGAVDLFTGAGLPEENIIKWDIQETSQKPGPYPEIAESDIFVNCIYLSAKIPPFVDIESLSKPSRRLRVVADVSCDTTNPHNPVPIYNVNTTFDDPCVRLQSPSDPPIDVISIDHLPSLLPREASEAFSADLLPTLLELKNRSTDPIWTRAEQLYQQKIQELQEYRRTAA